LSVGGPNRDIRWQSSYDSSVPKRPVAREDDRPTWYQRRVQPPDGGDPTTDPLWTVHLVDEANPALTLCELPIPAGQISHVGFSHLDQRNRCAECEMESDWTPWIK